KRSAARSPLFAPLNRPAQLVNDSRRVPKVPRRDDRKYCFPTPIPSTTGFMRLDQVDQIGFHPTEETQPAKAESHGQADKQEKSSGAWRRASDKRPSRRFDHDGDRAEFVYPTNFLGNEIGRIGNRREVHRDLQREGQRDSDVPVDRVERREPERASD